MALLGLHEGISAMDEYASPGIFPEPMDLSDPPAGFLKLHKKFVQSRSPYSRNAYRFSAASQSVHVQGSYRPLYAVYARG